MVICQRGSNVHAFEMGWTGGSQQWVFRTVTSDVAGTGGSTLGSSVDGTVTNSWVFLAGVYDAGTSQMRFYVNGVLQGTATVGRPFNATGPVSVGRTYDGGDSAYFNGQVDDVRMYAGALSTSDISGLYNQ